MSFKFNKQTTEFYVCVCVFSVVVVFFVVVFFLLFFFFLKLLYHDQWVPVGI